MCLLSEKKIQPKDIVYDCFCFITGQAGKVFAAQADEFMKPETKVGKKLLELLFALDRCISILLNRFIFTDHTHIMAISRLTKQCQIFHWCPENFLQPFGISTNHIRPKLASHTDPNNIILKINKPLVKISAPKSDMISL